MTKAKRVLNVGAGDGEIGVTFKGETDVFNLDAPGTGAQIEANLESDEDLKSVKGTWDIIWASHVMEHLPFNRIEPVMEWFYERTNPGGSCHIIVPSIEWACEQIMSEQPSPIVGFHIYGAQFNEWQFHKSMWTLPLTRLRLTNAGYKVNEAYKSQYAVNLIPQEGDEPIPYIAEAHYVIGVKTDE